MQRPESKQPSRTRKLKKLGALALASCVTMSCQTPDKTALTAPTSDDKNLDAKSLYIVDCLLPGQVRQLGGITYAGPRRPIKTTANDCEIRGGEYVAYDRADYRSALKVWLAQAENGDANAQTHVGEIYEKGIANTPDYQSAAQWYRRAAEQGFSRAQINLGYLYEKGLGVEKDILTALNWYRKASGLAEDNLVYESQANDALVAMRDDLTKKIDSANAQSALLNKKLKRLTAQRQDLQEERVALQLALKARSDSALQERLDEATAALDEAKYEIDILNELYSQANEKKDALASELETLPTIAFRNIPTPPLLSPNTTTDKDDDRNLKFGRYFALIIGNNDYYHLEDLRSPLKDARRLETVLTADYGFNTVLLPNADEKSILNALNDLYEQLTEQDNLLIYYAGHGNLTESGGGKRTRGYWLPIDAQTDRLTHWISNSVISDHLDRLKARAVLIIADSCYAGQMASEKSPFLLGSLDGTLSDDAIKLGLARRARLVISSGGVKPVPDGSAEQHSLFAGALIEVLENNKQVLRDSMLFSQLAVNVRYRQPQGPQQTPEMRPIRAAGHGGGDFFFVPKNIPQSAQRITLYR